MGMFAIGVQGKPVPPCSGHIFGFRCKKDGYTWGKKFGKYLDAAAYKKSFFDVRKAQFDAMNEDSSYYDVDVVEIPSTDHDIIYSLTGEWHWTGEFDYDGKKLYRLKTLELH